MDSFTLPSLATKPHFWILSAGLLLDSSAIAQTQDARVNPEPGPANQAPVQQGVPAPATSDACFPPCRRGFVCSQGQCISACNPPCPANLACVQGECVSPCNPPCPANLVCAQGQCISPCNPPCPQGSVCAASGECLLYDTGAEKRQAERQRNEVALKDRMSTRQSPRVVLYLFGGGGPLSTKVTAATSWNTVGSYGTSETTLEKVQTGGGGISAGYRQNLGPQFGVYAGLGLGLFNVTGNVMSSSGTTSSESLATMSEALVEFMPYAGPLGRFYLGPIFWGAYANLPNATRTVDSETTSTVFEKNTLWRAGAGVGAGLLLLRHEQLDLSGRVRFDVYGNPRGELAVGWHWLL
jgi:hypothetical protein